MEGGTLSLNAFFQTNPPFSRDNSRPTNVNKRENALPNSFLLAMSPLIVEALNDAALSESRNPH